MPQALDASVGPFFNLVTRLSGLAGYWQPGARPHTLIYYSEGLPELHSFEGQFENDGMLPPSLNTPSQDRTGDLQRVRLTS